MGRLLTMWLGCSGFVFLLLIIQTFSQKYGKEVGSAWGWFLVFVLPINAILLGGYFFRRENSDRVLAGNSLLLFRSVFWLSAIYLFALLMVLLIQPFGEAGYSEAKNLHITDMGLYIFQGLLLIPCVLFVFKTPDGDVLEGEPGVFISYSHADKEIVEQIREWLGKKRIPVTIDFQDMIGGQKIEEFIRNSIVKRRITLSVVSNKSLLSDWVAMETMNSLLLLEMIKTRQFIACYLEDDFFQPDFTGKAIESLDKKLEEINAEMEKREKLLVDSRDLNDLKTRLLGLRNNLDKIVEHLRSSLCVDIRGEKLGANLPLILKSIK